MENTNYIALSRQTTLWRQLDMVANNLANMNTIGFKGEAPMFVEYLEKSESQRNPFGEKISFVQDLGTVRNFEEGPITATGNPLDVAIQGDGYFVVEDMEGEDYYTRNGRFMLDSQGQLVTSSGNIVLSTDNQPFFLAPSETEINIASDGTVSTENGQIGKIRIVKFDDQQKLSKLHSGLFETTQDNPPQAIETPTVAQGMIEQSNVNAIAEVTKLIDLQRAYGDVQRMVDNEHERRTKAIEMIAMQGKA